MNKKLMTIWIIASMLLAPLAAAVTGRPVGGGGMKRVGDLGIFQASKFNAHYRVPRDIDVVNLLENEGILAANARPEQVQAAVQQFRSEWAKRNPTTPNPDKLRELLNREKNPSMALDAAQAPNVPYTTLRSLVVPVEFPHSSTFDWCGDEVTMDGPLHNQIAPPGEHDNYSIWYSNTTPELYDELYFGVGPLAGAVVRHPQLGTIDLRGNTMANYYLEQSEGKFLPQGLVYPKWFKAQKAEGYYGQDSCDGEDSNVYAGELVVEVLDLLKADDPEFPWQEYDSDGNGVVDNFTVIHAGMGQEAGGGAQGDFAIWSHASMIEWPNGYQVCTEGSVGCPDRDIFVREYSMDPENIDIGVIAEEFGHAAFGLPDLYSNDLQGSIAHWAIMESGSWNGLLAGMTPAPFPLWFRMLVGWANPLVLNYDGPRTLVKVGQLSQRPPNTQSGIKINLPDLEVLRANPMDTGKALWSTAGNGLENTIVRAFNLTSATEPVFSFESSWNIEENWDGGYVEVSTDGVNWTALDDREGNFERNELNGNNPDKNWVLTGEGEGTLTFDLAAYIGAPILLRLRYSTDTAVAMDGWWVDDFSLDNGGSNMFSDDLEGGAGNWTVDGWKVGPLTETFPRYYLVEWRNLSGFDRGLAYATHTIYSDEDEWGVERVPYSVPGMLVYFRDTTYDFDYSLYDSLADGPSYGPKHGLTLVDSHPFPMTWDEGVYDTGQNLRISDRLQTADAAFTLGATTPFTLDRTNISTGEVLETKTFAARPAVRTFHDAFGYYPGLWYNPEDEYFYFWNMAASAVVPAQGAYTTRITDASNKPLYELYGADLGDTILGSGDPWRDGVEFGVHMQVTSQAADGSWGLIRVWNSPTTEWYFPMMQRSGPSN